MLARITDRLLGRGEAAVTVPPFDGALKPNQHLEDAAVFAELPDLEDLASDGRELFAAQRTQILRLTGGPPTMHARFDQPITAFCLLADGGMAVALGGRRVEIVGGAGDGYVCEAANGVPFNAINALAATAAGTVLATDGSRTQPYANWCHDLMLRGRSGRVIALDPGRGQPRELARGLAYAFGACQSAEGDIWVCESWRHRLVTVEREAAGKAVLDALPVYPSRLAPATGGGFWLTAFTARTQLVEFVLRETAYRRRMMKEIEPQYWIAPKLSSGHTFLEPMQGAHIKTMGILKPWAPPVSYGLVIRLAADGSPLYSLHSRTGGRNHGVVAAVECAGHLYVLTKGNERILRLPIAEIEAELNQ
ncbi:hypothetical protein [Chelatococcus reniformis]|uniref:Strictosidine synthase n=1 Tax=Chelatococcus reniformis TaxID=1494448 RepID=A0A916ULT5_9HYPH|nr:hypothetical protein [Chelatococcus reniformis]GGC77503.1 hypothetical protein GCM10010994_39760 [Chelatococcus reniformis]